MYVTQEQLHKEFGEAKNELSENIQSVEKMLTDNINDVRSELREFKSEMSDFRVEMNLRFTEQEQRFDKRLSDWLVVIHTDIENFKIVIIEEFKKQLELQRYYFRQDMEVMMKKQREEFNADITRHMSVLGEEYQWRLAAVGEKVDITWEKCERKYVELEQKDIALADKVTFLGEYLSSCSRNHKGIGQAGRKSEKRRTNKK